MSTHHITVAHPHGTYVRIWFSYTPGRPAVMYLRNGDPGYPAEPAEVEFMRCSPHGFETWAEAYLADHEDEAIEQAEDDHDRDREDARAARMELAREDRGNRR